MREKFHEIFQLFPGIGDKIEYILLHNESFRELCIDYIFCSSKLSTLKMKLDQFNDHIKEFEDMQDELEQEILNLITGSQNDPE